MTVTTMLDQLTQWSQAMQALRLGRLDASVYGTTLIPGQNHVGKPALPIRATSDIR
jgi:ABC-type amino acid transport substrate-binding protein